MRIIIIGNGIAGASVARHIRKRSDHEIIMISEETPYFFSRTALMYVYMGQLKFAHTQPYADDFWTKNRIQLLQKKVISLNTSAQAITFEDKSILSYDALVLATGSVPNALACVGGDLQGVHGFYFKQDWEAIEKWTPNIQRAVIVGGGLIGIEMAEMFHSRQIPVTFVVREASFLNHILPKEESEMINREIRAQKGIDLRLNSVVTHIEGDAKGRVKAVQLQDGEKIACEFVGKTIGVSPNISLLKNTPIETEKGILVDEYLQTNVPNVYALGDCAQLRQPAPHRAAIEAVWYTGKLMAPILAQTICGQKTAYQQGVWFNSAKFFGIEYQVYGLVSPTPQPHETHLYWEHHSGKKAIRLVYDTTHRAVLGINVMGIRYRQEVCEQWILQKTPIETVIQTLSRANFDPEFFAQYESEIQQLFKAKAC